jgi:hypothetical protein
VLTVLLGVIEAMLDDMGMAYLRLDGQTAVAERQVIPACCSTSASPSATAAAAASASPAAAAAASSACTTSSRVSHSASIPARSSARPASV